MKMMIATAVAMSCLAGAARADTVSYGFSGGGSTPNSGSFTIQGFDTSLGTLDKAVVETTGSATFNITASAYAPTISYNLNSSQSIYFSAGPGTLGGPYLQGSGNAAINNSDFSYDVTLSGTGNYTYTTFLDSFYSDRTAYFHVDSPFGSVSGNGSALGYNVVSGTASGSGTITYYYTPLRSAVPEPATWATMIGGFALVGTAARRRRAIATA